jgi:hypothetical protein
MYRRPPDPEFAEWENFLIADGSTTGFWCNLLTIWWRASIKWLSSVGPIEPFCCGTMR